MLNSRLLINTMRQKINFFSQKKEKNLCTDLVLDKILKSLDMEKCMIKKLKKMEKTL